MLYFSSLAGYLSILTLCILGAVSVESLLLQWVCLEINMLCIIPILLSGATEDSIMVGVKYFVSQSSASVVFLISMLTMDVIEMSALFSGLAIIFKLGLPPFHSWMLSIIMNINLVELMLVLTVQKFIPLMILSHLGVDNFTLMLMGGLSLVMIATSMNSNFSFSYMLFLSSVSNGIWMVTALTSGSWLIFLALYSFMLAGVVMVLITGKITKFSDVALMDNSKKFNTAIYFLNLGGVPPLMGFAVKLVVLKSLVDISMLQLFMLVLLSVMVLYIYVSIMYQAYTVSPECHPILSLSSSSNLSMLSLPLLALFTAISWVAV